MEHCVHQVWRGLLCLIVSRTTQYAVIYDVTYNLPNYLPDLYEHNLFQLLHVTAICAY